jgi:hypothetical protein
VVRLHLQSADLPLADSPGALLGGNRLSRVHRGGPGAAVNVEHGLVEGGLRAEVGSRRVGVVGGTSREAIPMIDVPWSNGRKVA